MTHVVRRPLQHALDEVRFGPSRTLNLRASLPSAAEAVRRAEGWLRMKQAEGTREVLIITGRGNQSFGRVPVIREAVRRLLGLLSTRGVVMDHGEHSPGSFAVRLAPLSALSRVHVGHAGSASAAGERAENPLAGPLTLDGLEEATRERLRVLAISALQVLGIRDPSPAFIRDEMVQQCASLAGSLSRGGGTGGDRERLLLAAIERALDELDDVHR